MSRSAWRPMTADEAMAARACDPGRVRYPVASGAKKIARALSDQAAKPFPQITDRQAAALWGIVRTYRRQFGVDVLHARARYLRGSTP